MTEPVTLTPDEEYPAGLPNVQRIGSRHFVMRTEDGTWLWWHDCPASRSWRWFGRSHSGTKDSGHIVREADGITRDWPTVQGSLLCTDCGDHGFIENGEWRAA